MKLILVVLFSVMCWNTAFSRETERPDIHISVREGSNTIPVTLKNNWNKNITGLTWTVAQSGIPEWLTITDSPHTFDVLPVSDGDTTLSFSFDVIRPPHDATAVLPVVLKDALGNHWKIDLHIQVEGDKPGHVDALHENHPNPFNPTTTITYSLSGTRDVSLVIFNTLGQKVTTLVHSQQHAGRHAVTWNGTDDRGNQVSSGVYFYRLQAGRFTQTNRMLMIE